MTLKEMFKACCGTSRNMQKFAEDISKDVTISASSLYRIASGDIKSPVSDELLAAIVSHAEPGCGVTEADIRAAVDRILSTRVEPFEAQRKHMGDMLERSRNAVQNRILDSGAGIRRMITSSEPNHVWFDFGFNISKGDSSVKCMFDVASFGPRARDTIDRFVGHTVLRGGSAEDGWCYLILVMPKDGRGSDAAEAKRGIAEYLGDTVLAANLGILLLSDEDGKAHIDEFRLSSAPGPVSFGI